MRELALIDAIEQVLAEAAPARASRVVRWIGDDAAIVRAGGGYAVTSVDTVVDGVHFHLGQLTHEEIGYRAAASAVSDLAAMAVPEAGEAYLAVALAPGVDGDGALGLMRGAAAVTAEHGIVLCGGDVTSSATLSLTVTVVGWADDPGALVGRDGARAGDLVAVTGALGGAGAGLALAQGHVVAPAVGLDAAQAAHLHRRFAHPQPRLAAGRELSRLGATALIDVSDGVATDARHLARAGGVTLELTAGRLPRDTGVDPVAEALGADPGRFAATAGDDYELCVCLPAAAREAADAAFADGTLGGLSWIGRVLEADGPPGLRFSDLDGEPTGFEH